MYLYLIMVIKYYCYLLTNIMQTLHTFGCAEIGNKFTNTNTAPLASLGYTTVPRIFSLWNSGQKFLD